MCQELISMHLLRLSCIGEAITSYRFKTNFDFNTFFTTKRGYIEKLFKFKACIKQIPMMECVL